MCLNVYKNNHKTKICIEKCLLHLPYTSLIKNQFNIPNQEILFSIIHLIYKCLILIKQKK